MCKKGRLQCKVTEESKSPKIKSQEPGGGRCILVATMSLLSCRGLQVREICWFY